jgi:antitoxin component YwqK of YwqJK toxin-antitoxin module
MRFFYLLILFLLASCAADFRELEEKSGKLYKIGSEKPFTGTVEIYDSSMNTIGVFSSVNGVRSGPYLQFFKNGEIKIEGQYKAGFKHGIENEYNEKNVLIYEKEFSNGTVKSITANYDSGNKKYKKSYSGARRHEYYYEDGSYEWKTYKLFDNNKLVQESSQESALVGVGGIGSSYEWRTYYDNNEKPIESCQINGINRTFCITYCSDGREHKGTHYRDGFYSWHTLENEC